MGLPEKNVGQDVSAEDIQKMIEEGEDIIYKDKTIIGDFNLSLCKVPKIFDGHVELRSDGRVQCNSLGKKANFITSKINIVNCNINGNINFNNSIFCDSIIFENCLFKKNASFKCSRFRGPADFNRVEFAEDADFSNTNFRGYIRFDRSNFHKGAKFESAVFIAGMNTPFGDKNIIFYKSKFDALANFENVEFWEYADFGFSNFNSGALFRKTRFSQNANFENAIINEHANFEDSVFGRYLCNIAEGANFKGALFRGNINFQVSDFYNVAMFERSRFEGDTIFIGANFYDNLILRSAKIGRMHLRGINLGYKSIIILNDAEFEKLLVRWEIIKDHLDQGIFNPTYNDDAVYLQLIQGFKDRGLFEDADHCYYYYRSIKDNNSISKYVNKIYIDILARINFGNIIDPLACFTCGYGTSLGYILITSSSIIMLFGMIYWIYFIISNDHKSINAIIFSIMVFLSQLPNDVPIDEVMRYLVVLERFIGWIFMALFILLTKKLIR